MKPKEQNDLHRDIPKGLNLDKILCIRTERTLRNDSTLAHNGKLYQIQEAVKSKKVLVQERVNGTMLITHNDVSLKFKEITTRLEKQQKPDRILRKSKKQPPSDDRRWRKSNTQMFNPSSTLAKNNQVITMSYGDIKRAWHYNIHFTGQCCITIKLSFSHF
jgi:hypothetical protein